MLLHVVQVQQGWREDCHLGVAPWFKESQFPAVPELLGGLAAGVPGAQTDTSKWDKHYRNTLERSGQNHPFECSRLI